MFTQYVNRNVFELHMDVLATLFRILTSADERKHFLLTKIPRSRAIRLLKKMDDSKSLRILGRDHANDVLSGASTQFRNGAMMFGKVVFIHLLIIYAWLSYSHFIFLLAFLCSLFCHPLFDLSFLFVDPTPPSGSHHVVAGDKRGAQNTRYVRYYEDTQGNMDIDDRDNMDNTKDWDQIYDAMMIYFNKMTNIQIMR